MPKTAVAWLEILSLAHLEAYPRPYLDLLGRDPLDPAHHAKTFVEVDEDDVAGISIPAVHGGSCVNRSTAGALAGHLTLLFHPFLEVQEDRFEIMRRGLEELRALAQDGLVWCAPGCGLVGPGTPRRFRQ